MAIGYSSKFGTITSLNDLLGPKFKNAVALNGNPTSANAALNGVMMANLAQGGTASDISKGVDFFSKLKAAGNFSPVSATGATIKAGTTPVVFNWDYLNLPSYVGRVELEGVRAAGRRLGRVLHAGHQQAGAAPGGSKAVGGVPLLAGRVGRAEPLDRRAAPGRWSSRPCNPTAAINTAAAGKLPSVSGSPVFLTQTQNTDAANYLAANWAKAVG